jgi:hypothetical protein
VSQDASFNAYAKLMMRNTMNSSIYKRSLIPYRIVLTTMLAITFAGVVRAQDGPTGRIQQGLSGGSIVSPADQERYGLLTLSGGG